ncbi:mid1-interacting protein 1-B-like [Anas platyrhynchos]|uniref:Thyroid hormone responsive Spot 14 alpha n=1 Tax=Anas platyrhynchos TaxID=8839 RepID=Q38HW8_ANAPL|nr:mid1-interacting protein 1-B-like [Anas platyrhynchos]ABB16437.1 thyroid hormone responsive Spot 14 alpha [Anas platyrhynchos]
MEQYFSATQKMEQEVMFPSLLRGVFPQQERDGEAPEGGPTDLYEHYQLLKAIKPVVERGLASVTDPGSSGDAEGDTEVAPDDGAEGNLEERLSHHVNGLQQVLTDLTKNTKALTRRYSQILEQINLSDDQSSS